MSNLNGAIPSQAVPVKAVYTNLFLGHSFERKLFQRGIGGVFCIWGNSEGVGGLKKYLENGKSQRVGDSMWNSLRGGCMNIFWNHTFPTGKCPLPHICLAWIHSSLSSVYVPQRRHAKSFVAPSQVMRTSTYFSEMLCRLPHQPHPPDSLLNPTPGGGGWTGVCKSADPCYFLARSINPTLFYFKSGSILL